MKSADRDEDIYPIELIHFYCIASLLLYFFHMQGILIAIYIDTEKILFTSFFMNNVMIIRVFYTIFILNAFLFACPNSVYSKQERGFQVEVAQFSFLPVERDYRAPGRDKNTYNFKSLAISESFISRPRYSFSIFTDNFQVAPSSVIDKNSFAAMPKKLDFNIGYNFSPYLSIVGGFKKGMMEGNIERAGLLPCWQKNLNINITARH